MKIYNLNIDTSKPVNQTIQMQQYQTGLLNPIVTNGGKYIRNLTTKVYDGETEIPSTENGFKVDVGAEPKHVKVVATSTPLICQAKYVDNPGTGNVKTTWCEAVQIPAGTYSQAEFMPLEDQFGYKEIPGSIAPLVIFTPNGASVGKSNFDCIQIISHNPNQQVWFGKVESGDVKWLSPDEPLVVTEDVVFGRSVIHRRLGTTFITIDYPAIGYWTDYQMDTLVKPSTDAHYDGEYVEPLKEIEIDGVNFVPTTLTVDGVDYVVLAQPIQSSESNLEPDTEPTTEG